MKRLARSERERGHLEVDRAYRAKMDAIAWMLKATRLATPSVPPANGAEEDDQEEREGAAQITPPEDESGATIQEMVKGAVMSMKGEFTVSDISNHPMAKPVNRNTLGSCIRKLISEGVMETVEGTGRRNRRYRLR